MAGIQAGSAGRLSIEIVAEVARLQQDMDRVRKLVSAASGEIAGNAKAANDNLRNIGRGAGGGVQALSRDVAALKGQLDPAWAALQRYKDQVQLLQKALSQGAITHSTFVSEMRSAVTVYQNARKGVASVGTSLKMNGVEALNFSRQMADVGVTAAMGMNPLMIALQQGPQLFDILQMKAVQTGATIGAVAKAAGAQIWAAMAPLLPFMAAIAIAAGTIAAGFALGAREINKSSGDISKSLGLTEEQLKRVKKSGVNTAVTMSDTFFAFFDVVGDRLISAFDGPLKWLRDTWNAVLDGMVAYGNLFIKFIVGGFIGGVRGIAATWKLLPAAIADSLSLVGNKAIEGIEWIIEKSLAGINWMIRQANSILGTSFEEFDEKVSLGRNKVTGAAADFAATFSKEFMSGIKDAGDAVDRFWADVAKRALEIREKAIRDAAGDAAKAAKGPKGPKTDAEKFESLVGDVAREIAMIEAQKKAIGMAEDAALLFTNQQKLLNDAQAKGITLTDAYRATLMRLAADLTAAQIDLRKKQNFQSVEDSFKDEVRAISQAGERIGLYGEELDKVATYQEMLNTATRNGRDTISSEADAQMKLAATYVARNKAVNSAREFMAGLIRETEASQASMEAERGAVGLSGAALEAYRWEQEQLAKATAANVKLSPQQLAAIKLAAQGYGNARHELNQFLLETEEGKYIFAELADEAQNAANIMSSAFGNVGGTIGDVIAVLAEYGAKQEDIRNKVATNAISAEKAERDLARAQVEGIGAAISAAKGLFKEHSTGYKAMAAAEKAFAIVQMANTAINIAAGAAKMFATLGPFGFPAVAAMVAVMAGLGAAVSGGRASYRPPTAEEIQKGQGTGSVLGDAEAKSGSIANSLELMAKNSNRDLDYSNQMVKSLRAIETNIGALTSALSRQLNVPGGGFDTSGMGLGSTTKAPGWTLGIAPLLQQIPVIGGLVTGIIKALFGTTKKITLLDQGITFASSSIEDIINDGIAGQIYSDIQTQTKKKFFGLTTSNKVKVSTEYGDLDNEMERQVALIIGSLKSGVLEAAGILGVQGAEAALNAFKVDLGKISLKDLKGEEIQEQLEAVFSKLGDDMAVAAMPGLAKFQQVGEGLFETLARLAKNFATIDTALTSIGMTFGSVGFASIKAREGLIALFGSLDEFVDQTTFFRENFLTEAEQMAPIIAAVNAEMARLGIGSVTTNDQFKALVLGLDLSTEAGADMFASLMAVAPAFAKVTEYTTALTDAAKEAADQQLRDALALAEQRKAIAKQNAQTEFGLMERLAAAQGDDATVKRLQRENELRNATSETERTYLRAIYAAEDFKAAQDAATAAAEAAAARAKEVADEAREIAIAIAEQENSELARQMRLADERVLVDEANRAAWDYLQALREQKTAAEEAAAAASELAAKNKAIADEIAGLERQWLEVTGQTGAIRDLDLAALQSDRAREIQQAIWDYNDALERQKAAQEAAKAAADEYNRAMDAARSALSQAYERERSEMEKSRDAVLDFAASIREFRDGLVLKSNPAASLMLTQARFLNTTAMARSGDQEARGRVTGDAQAYLDAALARSTSAEEYQRVLATVLGQTGGLENRALSEAQKFDKQITALEKQVGLFIDLNDKVLSVDEAIADLQSITLEQVVPDLTASFDAGFSSVTAELKQGNSTTQKAADDQKVVNIKMAGDLSDLKDLATRMLFALEESGIVVSGSVTIANTDENPVPVDQVA